MLVERFRVIWHAHRTMPFLLKWLYNVTLFLGVVSVASGLLAFVPAGEVTYMGDPLSGEARTRIGVLYATFGVLALVVCDAVARKAWWARIGLSVFGAIGTTMFVLQGISRYVPIPGPLIWFAVVTLLVVFVAINYLFTDREAVSYFRDPNDA
jgi:hypothetical protein